MADLLDHLAVVASGFTALARGEDDPGPGDGLRACLEHVEVFVPQAPLPELWGDPVPAADAPVLHRVVAVTGRVP